MNKILISTLVLFVFACNNKQGKLDVQKHQKLIDTLMPRFAKLHDSIPNSRRFDPSLLPFYQVHKIERKYELQEYACINGEYFFAISRLEPSIKKDKYAIVCGSFKRKSTGEIDSSSYREIYWTWKMLKNDLIERNKILFEKAIKGEDLSDYLPEKSGDKYIMFPDGKVSFDRASQSWK